MRWVDIELTEEEKDRLRDFFTPAELVEYLGLDINTILSYFEADIIQALEDINELMGVKG